jgi:hypothetical protein
MIRSKELAVLVAGAVAALALGSFAVAGVPDGGGVVHGCYEKESGKLRVTDTATNQPKACTSKEIGLDWNQKGERGPSNAYSASRTYRAVPAQDNYATIVTSTTDLPAGQYVVSAKVVVSATGLNVAPTGVNCALVLSGGNGGTGDHGYGTVSSNASGWVLVTTLSMQMDSGDWLANGGKAWVACDAPVALDARNTKITAIQVASLTSS